MIVSSVRDQLLMLYVMQIQCRRKMEANSPPNSLRLALPCRGLPGVTPEPLHSMRYEEVRRKEVQVKSDGVK
jgi:hypothetical protein